jgi:hypothetical protein
MRHLLLPVLGLALTSCATYENATIYGRWRDVTREDIVAAVAAARAQAEKFKEPRVNLEIISVGSRDEIQLLWDQTGPHRAHDYIKRVLGRWEWVMETIDVG